MVQIPLCQPTSVIFAPWTLKPFRPAQLPKVLKTRFFRRKPILELQQSLGIVFHAKRYYILGVLESSAYPQYEIPFWDMKCGDELTANTDDYVLYKDGEVYLVYLKFGGSVTVDITKGRFTYGWFNPRTGDGLDGLINAGTAEAGKLELKAPDNNDWLLVLRGSGELKLALNAPIL